MKIRGQEVLDPRARIMSHVAVSTETGCWEWQGALKGTSKLKRYGSLIVGSRTTGTRRSTAAHRYAWEVFRGPVPNGMWVLHRCDNPPCVNPDHLFLGDRRANTSDRDAKGRNVIPRGEQNGNVKLTDAEVAEIRAAYRPWVVTSRMLGERFGVSPKTIKGIVQGRSRRVPPPPVVSTGEPPGRQR